MKRYSSLGAYRFWVMLSPASENQCNDLQDELRRTFSDLEIAEDAVRSAERILELLEEKKRAEDLEGLGR